MQGQAPELPRQAKRLADALENAGVPYALGGALAYGYWRGTRLDRAMVRSCLVEMVGGEDERIRKWAELDARFRSLVP